MKTQQIIEAIKYLKPNAEFVLVDGDYSQIEWIVLDGEAPTLVELEEAHLQVKAAEEAALAGAIVKRESALAKLAALGLDTDDLKALGL